MEKEAADNAAAEKTDMEAALAQRAKAQATAKAAEEKARAKTGGARLKRKAEAEV